MAVMQGAIAAIGQKQRPPGEQVGEEIVQFPVMRQGVVGAVVLEALEVGRWLRELLQGGPGS